MPGRAGGLAGVGGAFRGRPADAPGEAVVRGVGVALAQALEKLLRAGGARRRGEVGEEARAQLPDFGLGVAGRDPVTGCQGATSTPVPTPVPSPARVRS